MKFASTRFSLPKASSAAFTWRARLLVGVPTTAVDEEPRLDERETEEAGVAAMLSQKGAAIYVALLVVVLIDGLTTKTHSTSLSSLFASRSVTRFSNKPFAQTTAGLSTVNINRLAWQMSLVSGAKRHPPFSYPPD